MLILEHTCFSMDQLERNSQPHFIGQDLGQKSIKGGWELFLSQEFNEMTAFLVSLHNHVCSHSLFFPFTDTLESHRRLLKALPWASLTPKLEYNMEKQRLFLTTSMCLFDLSWYQSIQSAVTKSPRLDNLRTTESDSHCSRWEIQDEETGYYILRMGQAGS